jgi:hypothetical protein
LPYTANDLLNNINWQTTLCAMSVATCIPYTCRILLCYDFLPAKPLIFNHSLVTHFTNTSLTLYYSSSCVNPQYQTSLSKPIYSSISYPFMVSTMKVSPCFTLALNIIITPCSVLQNSTLNY